MGLVLEGAAAAARRVPAGQIIVHQFNGGAAVFVEPNAPFNKTVALGFDGVPSPEVLGWIEDQFSSREAPLQAEVATLAEPGVARALTKRGYELVGYENVLALALDSSTRFEPILGVDVTRASESESGEWLDTVAVGFMHPDTFDGPSSQPQLPRDVLDRVFGDTLVAPRFERYIARRGQEVAGGASFRIQDGVAQLSGAATLPAHRRQGVQSALLRHRLAEAVRRGCDIAVVTTEPGSKSQENVQKAGFALLYARAVLVKSCQLPATSRQPEAAS